MNQTPIDWKKYLIVFLLTAGLFLMAIYLSNYFGNQKINDLKSTEDNIALDILSSETQFSLLSELSCKNITDSVLSSQLGEMGAKLEWSEKNLGNTPEVLYLRKYYSLLEIKDYLLMRNISARCGTKYAFILYFYTNADNCSQCGNQGLVLSDLRDKYPSLRVYSFDYSTDLSAVKAMLDIYKIKDTVLPAVVLEDEVLTGFHSETELESKIKQFFGLEQEGTKQKTSSGANIETQKTKQ